MNLLDFCELRGMSVDIATQKDIDEKVRRAAYSIIEGKGATYYGIGSALARIVEILIGDQRAIMTVCSPHDEVEGTRDVTLALPQILGGNGILATLELNLSADEHAALYRSAVIVREAIDDLEQVL